MRRPVKIAVAIPSHDSIPYLFAYDLAGLCAFTSAVMPEGSEFGVLGVSGTYIHQARQELADAIVAQGLDYVLWLDSDMRFPKDALIRLLEHKLPMVGINYAARGVPSHFIAIKKAGIGADSCRLETHDDSAGLEEVDALGFGCVLMHVAALKDMPDPKVTPWFQNQYLGDGHWMGEDVFFCDLFRKAGGRIFVDHDLSKCCAHIGQFEYTLNLAESEATV